MPYYTTHGFHALITMIYKTMNKPRLLIATLPFG